MIVKIDIPEDFFKKLSEAYDEVNAMKSVIAEAASNGNPILPSDSYHKAYVETFNTYRKLTNQVVPVVCPEFAGSNATWMVDFDAQQVIIDTVDMPAAAIDNVAKWKSKIEINDEFC